MGWNQIVNATFADRQQLRRLDSAHQQLIFGEIAVLSGGLRRAVMVPIVLLQGEGVELFRR
jgi:hypothetical protein